MFRFLSVLAGAAAFATPVPAMQAAPSPEASAATPIAIHFNPPLGQPLRYRVTKTNQAERNDAPVSIDYELTFSARQEGGFRLLVRAVDIGTPGLTPTERQRLRATILPLMPPYVVLVAADATLQEVENEDAYWRGLADASERSMRQAPHGDGTMTGQIAAMVRDMPPEGRRAELFKYLIPLTELASVEVVLGEERANAFDGAGRLGATLRQHSTMRADRVADGHMFVTGRNSVSPEDALRTIEETLARISAAGGAGLTDERRDRILEDARNAHLERSSEMSEVALETGLTRRYRAVTRITWNRNGQPQTNVETFTIERVN